MGTPESAGSGALLALLAAVCWGGGDFSGGMGAKTAGGSAAGALRVVVTAHAISLPVLLAILAGGSGGVVLRGAPVAWGLGCGVVAGLSVGAFYLALARGTMGVSAAVSGLLAAAIPAGVGTLLEGRPSWERLLGFGLAAAAIWLIAAPGTDAVPERAGVMPLAIAGGVGFGLYFAGLKFANPLGVVEPAALARCGSLGTCSLLLLALGRGGPPGWLSTAGWMWAIGVAVLDTSGNLLYISATRAGRLDVAAVLASLYPASTIVLAAGVLGERPVRRQVMGMGIAVAAVVLVTV